MSTSQAPAGTRDRRPAWLAAGTWVLAWALLFALDAHIDLANKALVLVLASAVAAIGSGLAVSLLASAVAVLAFNFAFVPPRGTFDVDLRQHALLLVTMLSVSWIVSWLVARQRGYAVAAEAAALRSDQLRRLGEALRATDDASAQADALREALDAIGGGPTVLLLAGGTGGDADPGDGAGLIGTATADEQAGLQLCLQGGHALGPGSGRYDDQPAWYLPLRGRLRTQGAALVRLAAVPADAARALDHALALCDQMGVALERAAALRAAAAAHEQAREQSLRNTLLAAIAHDHRTPLATILGAASALHDQDERLSPAQRRRLAATIVDEATQLARLTDNTLQLARLGAVGLTLRRDWESVEELVGNVLRRLRQRDPAARVKARVEPGLPLLHCDAQLMVQLLDNLVDNALRHGGAAEPAEIVARRLGADIVIAVRDRGPGVPVAQRERVFEPFERGHPVDGAGGDERPRRGAGIGLALCRAIARAHGGELRLRARAHGGASFELVLPVPPEPEAAAAPDGQEAAP